MAAPRPLPARPSLDSLRKQAKKLARDAAAGRADAIARVRAQVPGAAVDTPLTQRDAQLVIAREYGYRGWQDLIDEVGRRLGGDLARVAARARQLIHEDDVEGLQRLILEYPALLAWQEDDDRGGVLGFATGAYGDAGDPERERWFTRGRCAELLLDAGAVVTPTVLDGLLQSRARGLLDLFDRKGRLPRTLRFQAALGDTEAVRLALERDSPGPNAVVEAFVAACRFGRTDVALLLLDRVIAHDPGLGARVDATLGRRRFVEAFIETRPPDAASRGLWTTFAAERISRAVTGDQLAAFVEGLRDEPWLLGPAFVDVQERLIANAAQDGREAFIRALFDADPAILRAQPPPRSQAIEHALTYGHAHLVPLLTRIWPLPDDLPHAAGMGDLGRVRRWFDGEGKPALGDPARHAPATSPHPREPQWGPVGVQEVLDTALAWAVVNRRFDVADFLLAHGADVSTRWNSHEPASILHHLVFLPDPYDRMRFLVDRGIDLTITDYRWNSTAAGWARYGHNDERMARWLEDAARERDGR
jgi:hypothetical protein